MQPVILYVPDEFGHPINCFYCFNNNLRDALYIELLFSGTSCAVKENAQLDEFTLILFQVNFENNVNMKTQ